jgi:hypothetical protein
MEPYMYGVIYGVLGERRAFDRPHSEPPVRGGTLAGILNELVSRGWEFVTLSSSQNHVVCIVRKSQSGASSNQPRVQTSPTVE